jgi:hypothetical protein
VEELDALLRQVDDLRLTLETDLSLAAAALEAGVPELALDVVDSDRAELAAFEQHALHQLADLSRHRRRSWVPAHAASIAVAAGLVGLLAGVLPQALAPRQPDALPVSAAATESLERLQDLALNGDANDIREASAELHAQLAAVVDQAHSDPAAAQTALLLLSYEQNAIARSSDRGALRDVLRQSQALARRIRAALPVAVRTSLPDQTLTDAATSSDPAAKPSPTASPKPTATASPKPATSPTPSASPSPSPKSDTYPLPEAPIQP